MKLKSYLLPPGMLLAGAAALLTGLLPWPAFQELAGRTVPVLAFVVAMSVVTELVDDAGLFRVVTERLAALGRGRVFLLWLLVVALATVSTVFLSLDTTAVLVTPVVVLLAQDRLNLSPAAFASLVWAPALVGVLVPVALLWLAFRKDLAGRYGPQPVHKARDKVLLYSASGVMVLLLPALVSGVPVQIPAMAAAAALLCLFLWRRRPALHWSMLPWRPLMLTSGLFMVESIWNRW